LFELARFISITIKITYKATLPHLVKKKGINLLPTAIQPGLSWRASALRQMALAGVPARYNKIIVVIRQYGPTFATTHGGIQCDCGGGFP
jgi:hypothetical protein